ncbi:MAG: glycosyltransferase family 4 protein [Ferruginibacter sp.]|nr:glycosyltransferase family 4 protein [Ferruginibacter sp.]
MDGTLFAECEMLGANRDGMMRLTEDVTDKLILESEIDLSFINTLNIEKYDTALKKFVKKKYPNHTSKIISTTPPKFTNIFKWKNSFRKNLPSFLIDTNCKELNQFNIFHSFYYPFSKAISKNKIKKSITYLDIIPLKLNGYPKNLVERTKNIVSCIAGNYAISISEFSKQDLLNYDNRIKAENVFVAPLAASPFLFYQSKNVQDWYIVKEKYKLPDNYFLCVAGNDSRKNVRHVITSFNKLLLQQKYKDIHLVLTGNTSHSVSMLDELNISAEIRAQICMPKGYIDSKDLAVLYSNSISFFFMSLYEGFGLPALEAMQCGVPTVVSNVTSLPEVVGDAGILLPPTDVDALCETMNNLYLSDELREKYSTAGLKRAEQFSWGRCANKYATIFKLINAK